MPPAGLVFKTTPGRGTPRPVYLCCKGCTEPLRLPDMHPAVRRADVERRPAAVDGPLEAVLARLAAVDREVAPHAAVRGLGVDREAGVARQAVGDGAVAGLEAQLVAGVARQLGVDAAVGGLRLDRALRAGDGDVAVARLERHVSRDPVDREGAVARLELGIALGAGHREAAVGIGDVEGDLAGDLDLVAHTHAHVAAEEAAQNAADLTLWHVGVDAQAGG